MPSVDQFPDLKST